jgi:hypothetical protein
MPQRLVSRSGKVVRPFVTERFRTETMGNFHGVVGRTGINHDDLVNDRTSRTQTLRQTMPLVFRYHSQRESPARKARLAIIA